MDLDGNIQWAPEPNVYTMRMQRVGGSITTATVAVNGTQVATAADFASASYIERQISPHQIDYFTNSFTVALKGAAGAGLTISIVGLPSSTFALFGPKVYTKTSTTPTHFVESFALPAGASTPYVMSATASIAGTKATITLNGVQVIKDVDFGTNIITVTKTVSLLAGTNAMLVDVRGTTGKTITLTITASDKTSPVLTIAAPAPNFVTSASTVTITGTSTDRTETQVTVTGAGLLGMPATMSGTGHTQYSATIGINAGVNVLTIRALDKVGNHTDSTRTVTRDSQAPTLTVTSPVDNSYTNQDAVTVSGTVTDASAVTVKVNGVSFPVATGGTFSGSSPVVNGANFLTIVATDAGGLATTIVRKVTQAKVPPVITVTAPTALFFTKTTPLPVSGTVTGTTPITVSVNGVAMTVSGSSFSGNIPLVEGQNEITFTATDPATNQTIAHRSGKLDTHPPVLSLTSPADGSYSNATTKIVTGTATDANPVTVTVNGVNAPVGANGIFTATVPLSTEGANTITVVANDAATNQATASRSVIRDTQAPVLSIASPVDNLVTKTTPVQITGSAVDASAVTVSVNTVPLVVNMTGAVSGSATLAEGANTLSFVATDAAGNTASQVRQVTLDTQGPVLTVNEPADGTSFTSETIVVSGTVADATGVTVTVNGNPVSVAGGAFSTSVPLSAGANTITIVTTDGAGNTSSATRTVTRTVETPPAGSAMTESFPRDPAVQAPAVSASVATTPFAAGAFLYSGPNPLQTGVAPGTIEPRRGAIVRGRVLGKDGLPLAGVEVTVLDHPEFGRTITRASGQYDLAVNGGARLMLHYAKSGLLEVIRGAEVEWQDYTVLDEVILIGLDPQVTLVDLSGGTGTMQVARASAQTDADGTRQATVLFPAGTTATMVLADGTTRSLDTLHVRATEYTVGENGPKMMPAALPPTSRYTYAVELTVDEANVAGATSVHLSQTVPFYIENFLGFPVGLPVPVGVLDRKRAVWVPDDNGVIIKIVGKTDGLADIDANGDSVADNLTELATLGITADERTRLATLYETGRSLWRIPLTHFSAIDGNFPASDSVKKEPPKVKPTKSDKQSKSKCVTAAMSTIECQTQVLGERVGLIGVPFALHYRSDRVSGRKLANTIEIPLIDGVVPSGLHRVGLKVEVAGREFSAQFVPAANLQDAFVWDGIDSYGRKLQGGQPVKVTISYAYDAYYGVPADVARSFGLTCRGEGRDFGNLDCLIPDSVSTVIRKENILQQVRHMRIGPFSAGAAALGGWSLDSHDAYDVAARELYTGDGQRRSAQAVGAVVTTLLADLDNSEGVAVGPSGTLFIADMRNSFSGTLLSFGSDGVIDTITTAIRAPRKMAVDRAGRVYVISSNQALYRVTPVSRTVELIAGTPDTTTVFDTRNDIWKPGRNRSIVTLASSTVAHGPTDGSNPFFGPDATGLDQYLSGRSIAFTVMPPAIPATDLRSTQFNGVAIGPDGTIYLSERTGFVWRIGPDGMATVYAGTGLHGATPDPDGGLAFKSSFTDLQGIAVGPDGILYLADGKRIRRVGTDGVITSVAGNLDGRTGNDGGVATDQLLLEPTDLSVGSDGVYILDSGEDSTGAGHIYLLQTDGRMIRVAGRDPFSRGGDGELATRGLENTPLAIAVGPDGTVYGASHGQVRAVHPPLEGVGRDEIAVAAEDGNTLDVFNGDGLHLRTMDALTGVALLRFGYDTLTRFTTVHTAFGGDTSIVSGHEFFLKSATDAFGNATTIVRNDSLKPLAIVGPFGQRSELALDADGLLSRVTNPAGEAVGFTYHVGGLLATETDPLGRVSRFTYDSTGLLVRDQDPAGGALDMARTEFDGGWEVSETSTLGRTTKYRVETRANGGEVRTNTSPAGLFERTINSTDGTAIKNGADGTITTVSASPDPRFGMQAASLAEMTTTTPGGLILVVSERRSTQRSDPEDPSSPLSLFKSIVVNDREFDYGYDAATRTHTVVTPTGRISSTSLDTLGRVIGEATPGVTALQYVYDDRGRLIQTARGSRIWNYTYGADGALASVTDPILRTHTFAYNTTGRLISRGLPGNQQLLFAYDANGALISLTPPSRPAHGFTFNDVNLLTSYNPPSLGGGGTWSTTFQYDLDRRPVQIVRPDGLTMGFAYDSVGRPSSVTVPGGILHYTYDASTGMLSGVGGPYGASHIAFSYDASLLTGVTWDGLVSGIVAVTYNNDFQVSGISVNNTPEVTFSYDGDGLMSGAGEIAISRSADNGLINGTALGLISTSQGYTALGEIARQSAMSGSDTLFDRIYGRDSLGRITDISETVAGVTTTRSYQYDLSGRLIEVRESGAITAAYEYDGNGNPLRVTRPSGVGVGTYDAQDRLLNFGLAAYAYTRNGELSSKTVGSEITSYEYDVLGNLGRVNLPGGRVVEYVIDGLNRRVGKKVNGVLVNGWLYQNQLNPIAELDGAGNVVSRFVYGSRKNVPDYMVKNGVTYRLLVDHLGSVRLVVNASNGMTTQRIDYDEWGHVVNNTNPGFQPFGFAGGLYDDDVGLVHLGVRDYDGVVGRWTVKDPVGLVGGTNLYMYASGDPINFVDVTGFCGCDVPLLVGLDDDVVYDMGPRSRGHVPKALFAPEVALQLSFAIRAMNDQGVIPQINSGYRTAVEQEAQRGHGPAAEGVSLHQLGYAVDFQTLDSDGNTSVDFDVFIHPIMVTDFGFTWGGRFEPKHDPPHFQLRPPKGDLQTQADAVEEYFEECILK